MNARDSLPAAAAAPMTDLSFAVHGEYLPGDYRAALWDALLAALPWLDEDPRAGVHGIRTAGASAAVTLLPRRARMLMRVPAPRVDEAVALAGRTLALDGVRIEIGDVHERPLVATNTVYSACVVTGHDDEFAFMQDVTEALDALGVAARTICGRRCTRPAGARELVGYPLALHELKGDASLRIQAAGLGMERRLGCGLFVPHKTISGLD